MLVEYNPGTGPQQQQSHDCRKDRNIKCGNLPQVLFIWIWSPINLMTAFTEAHKRHVTPFITMD